MRVPVVGPSADQARGLDLEEGRIEVVLGHGNSRRSRRAVKLAVTRVVAVEIDPDNRGGTVNGKLGETRRPLILRAIRHLRLDRIVAVLGEGLAQAAAVVGVGNPVLIGKDELVAARHGKVGHRARPDALGTAGIAFPLRHGKNRLVRLVRQEICHVELVDSEVHDLGDVAEAPLLGSGEQKTRRHGIPKEGLRVNLPRRKYRRVLDLTLIHNASRACGRDAPAALVAGEVARLDEHVSVDLVPIGEGERHAGGLLSDAVCQGQVAIIEPVSVVDDLHRLEADIVRELHEQRGRLVKEIAALIIVARRRPVDAGTHRLRSGGVDGQRPERQARLARLGGVSGEVAGLDQDRPPLALAERHGLCPRTGVGFVTRPRRLAFRAADAKPRRRCVEVLVRHGNGRGHALVVVVDACEGAGRSLVARYLDGRREGVHDKRPGIKDVHRVAGEVARSHLQAMLTVLGKGNGDAMGVAVARPVAHSPGSVEFDEPRVEVRLDHGDARRPRGREIPSVLGVVAVELDLDVRSGTVEHEPTRGK